MTVIKNRPDFSELISFISSQNEYSANIDLEITNKNDFYHVYKDESAA